MEIKFTIYFCAMLMTVYPDLENHHEGDLPNHPDELISLVVYTFNNL